MNEEYLKTGIYVLLFSALIIYLYGAIILIVRIVKDTEIVRCKDCVYWHAKEEVCVVLMTADENGFCAWGERREDAEINPCRGCEDYGSKGGCKSKGACGERRNND